MIEWVLLVWMVMPGIAIADPIEIGTYRVEADCNFARDSVMPAEGVSVIAQCVPRDK